MNESRWKESNRRSFLQTATTAIVATNVQRASIGHAATIAEEFIDTNVALGQWPFRQVPLSNTKLLVAKLHDQGVTQAWAGSLDALLHKDISRVNEQLSEQCKRLGQGILVPIGAVNPVLPGWEKDLRICAETHRMPGIRLHPNYHGYNLEDSVFERVLELANEYQLLVQIAVVMEDERTLHPLVNVPATDTTGLDKRMEKFPKIRLQLLNAFRSMKAPQVVSLANNGIHFEIAMLEGVAGVGKLFEKIPLTSLCFGSYAPVFYFESARLKLQESVLANVQLNALCSENALRLIPQR